MAISRVSFDYSPQDKQKVLHGIKARQILFGGSAGGGKSHAMRWDGIIFCLQNPGLQAYLFRRTLGELEDNHIREIVTEIPDSVGTYNGAQRAINFTNGAILRFCYCEKENDVLRYQGAEIHWLGIDEATHLSPSQIAFLRTRNRLGKYSLNPEFKDKEYLPRFVMASNPGGPSHSYLKSIFMDGTACNAAGDIVPKMPMELFYDDTTADAQDPDDRGWSSIYIPARMADNKYLDKGYAGSFSGLPAERAKALRDGDWDAIVGAALDMLSRGRHMVKAFRPPPTWTKFMSIDWGTAAPFCVGWFAVATDDTEVRNNPHIERTPENPDASMIIPRNAVVMYNELYGWNGRPNVGTRMDAGTVARKILQLEDFRGDVMDYRVGDSQMWAQSDGPSVQENMYDASEGRFQMRQSLKDRRANYSEFISRLAGNPVHDGTEAEHPMFFITDNCTHFWRTVPTLIVDTTDPDRGPSVDQEDHCVIGSTLVRTPQGNVAIEDLSARGTCWTPHGWQTYINLGCTGRAQEVFKITLANGQSITATSGHPLLTNKCIFVKVRDLSIGTQIIVDDFSWHSISRARHIGSAAFIINDGVSASIAQFGRIIMDLFRRVFTFIIATVTGPTMTLATSNSSPLAYISHSTSEHRNALLMDECTSNGYALWRRLGMGVMKGAHGIVNMPRRMGRFLHRILTRASSAERRGFRNSVKSSIAQVLAGKKPSASAILTITSVSRSDVYNLHVPVGNTVFYNGIATHNCYDCAIYALRSRPYITTPGDRWEQQYGSEWRKLSHRKGGDAYSTESFAR